MNVAFIGVSHWHARLYYAALAGSESARIVGVSDPSTTVVERVAAELGVSGFVDVHDLLEAMKPDFVFAFAPHSQLAAISAELIDRSIPHLVEKPGGIDAGEVAALRDRAAAKQLYVATGFTYRVADFVRRIHERVAEDPVRHMSFRFMSGSPLRYRETGNGWMLDPVQAGGGSMINLGIHFFDLFRHLTGGAPETVVATTSDRTWRTGVEDYSSTILVSPDAVCTAETGYAFPGAAPAWDIGFAVRTERRYYALDRNNRLEIHTDGKTQTSPAHCENAYWYGPLVRETLDRYARGEPPVAGLAELADAMTIVDAAYRSAASGAAPQAPDRR